MRTTVRLEDELYRNVRQRAAETGRTITAFMEDTLRSELARRQSGSPKRGRVHLTTVGGHGVRPGVDLDDTAGLLDLMETPDDAH